MKEISHIYQLVVYEETVPTRQRYTSRLVKHRMLHKATLLTNTT